MPQGKPTTKRKAAPKRTPKPNGHPVHEVTNTTKRVVENLVLLGHKQEKIACVLGIDPKTLRKHYRDQLDNANERNLALLMNTALMQAVGGPELKWKEANPGMTKWLLQVLGGLKEPARNINLGGAVGTYDLSQLSDDQLAQLHALLSNAAIAGGVGSGDGEEGG